MSSTKSNLFPFDHSRSPSPPVFDNNLSDFDSESDQDITDCKNTESNPTEVINDQDVVFSTSNIAKEYREPPVGKINKPNFFNGQFRYNETAECANPNTGSQNSLNNSIKTEDEIKTEAKHSQMKEIGKKSQAVGNDSKEENDIEQEIEIGDKLKDWNKLWTLQNEDLIETQTSTDSTIWVDPSLTESARKPVPVVKVQWGKLQKYPRIYHLRSSRKCDYNRLSLISVYSGYSPLTILKNIATANGMEPSDILEYGEDISFESRTQYKFPCMQCYERQSTSRDTYGFTESYNQSYGYGSVVNGKCTKCGGKVTTMRGFVKMFKQLKELVEENNLLVHDVYPDGNCLFGAVVDQLRIRGIFSYTVQNLRQAAVDYLRDHPYSSDGVTHYQLFLSDETWDEYLCRMSKDGEWGDHMMLSAISNIIHQKIVIFGGQSGEEKTVILPTDMQQQVPERAKTKGSYGSEMDIQQPKDSLAKTGHDNSRVRSEKARLESLEKDGTIILGHFGESHYISLRPKDWYDKLFHLDTNVEQKTRRHKQPAVPTKISMDHLNFFLMQFYQFNYLTSAHSEQTDFVVTTGSFQEAKDEGVGNVINKLAPCFDHIQTMSPDVGDFLYCQTGNDGKPKYNWVADDSEMCTLLHIPNDTKIRHHRSEADRFDLLSKSTEWSVDLIRLVPHCPEKWRGNTVEIDGHECVLAIDLEGNKLLAFAMSWPAEARGWMKRKRPALWPDQLTIDRLEENGCHVIPLIHATEFEEFRKDCVGLNYKQMTDKSIWAISFAVPEREMARCMSPAQKNSYYLFELFTDFVLQDKNFPMVACKHIFFYACENIRKVTWENSPGTCFLILLRRLSDSLSRGFIPHYFMPAKNMLNGIPDRDLQSCHKKIEFARKKPWTFLYFLLDRHKVTSTEIGPLLDEIIEDTDKFQVHEDIQRTAQEAFIPGSCSLLENFVGQGEYDFAMHSILCLKEKLSQVGLDQIDLHDIISNGLWNSHIGYSWCVAFYMDITLDTRLSKVVCERQRMYWPTVSLADVFGPEITNFLPDTVVFQMFLPTFGDLYFPREIVKVLRCAGKTLALSKCLRYYLDTYYDFVGRLDISGISATQACLLFNLYTSLFDCYSDLGEKEEFKDLLPRLREAGKYLNTAACSKRVERICKELDEHSESTPTTNAASKPLSIAAIFTY